jgi:hypothetical protein
MLVLRKPQYLPIYAELMFVLPFRSTSVLLYVCNLGRNVLRFWHRFYTLLYISCEARVCWWLFSKVLHWEADSCQFCSQSEIPFHGIRSFIAVCTRAVLRTVSWRKVFYSWRTENRYRLCAGTMSVLLSHKKNTDVSCIIFGYMLPLVISGLCPRKTKWLSENDTSIQCSPISERKLFTERFPGFSRLSLKSNIQMKMNMEY